MRYYICEKCGFRFAALEHMIKDVMLCGALMGFSDEGNPVGCGGGLKEIGFEEAMSYE